MKTLMVSGLKLLFLNKKHPASHPGTLTPSACPWQSPCSSLWLPTPAPLSYFSKGCTPRDWVAGLKHGLQDPGDPDARFNLKFWEAKQS